MGLEKFLDDAAEIKITEKKYKEVVDKELKNKFEEETNLNLFSIEKEEKKVESKKAMSIYFKESDLNILKAVAQNKGITVNKLINDTLEMPLKITKENLPRDFNIEALAKEYDKNNKKKSNKRKRNL